MHWGEENACCFPFGLTESAQMHASTDDNSKILMGFKIHLRQYVFASPR